jgi:spore coat polysaccharide biosynthesis protein SpsF (cytidylyltransferase family)
MHGVIPVPLCPQFPQGPEVKRKTPEDETRERWEKDREKELNKERQLRLKADTDKLLKLANELKQYVDKSNENTLSLDVIRKAEEIEKLAKSVKDKMRGPN